VLKNPSIVFIVDRDQLIAEILSKIFERNGFTTQSFTDPRQAILAARDGAPDLLVTDVVMPELSGIELAVAIQYDCPSCEIILFSGHIDAAGHLSTAGEQGHYFPLLSKPLHPIDLLARIGQEYPALEWRDNTPAGLMVTP
jgi:DNA-binding NtrC family response regulator